MKQEENKKKRMRTEKPHTNIIFGTKKVYFKGFEFKDNAV
jgi:hypothetical protein